MAAFAYPAVRRSLHRFVQHGVTIPDPFEWLEDPNSEETAKFVAEQNDCFRQFMSGYAHSEDVFNTISKMQDYARHGPPTFHGQHYYYYYNTGLQNQSVLYRTTSLAPGIAFGWHFRVRRHGMEQE